jgi:hypothetical protein
MGVVLIDLQDDDSELPCNWWNWRPTVDILGRAGLLRPEQTELMHRSCSGAVVDEHPLARLQLS